MRGDARRLWRALRHPQAPAWLKLGVVGLVIYVVSPIDLVPDIIPLLGFADELVLEVPESELDWAKEAVPRLMAGVAQLKVPLLAEVGVGHNWDQAH